MLDLGPLLFNIVREPDIANAVIDLVGVGRRYLEYSEGSMSSPVNHPKIVFVENVPGSVPLSKIRKIL